MKSQIDIIEAMLCGAAGAVMGADLAMPRELHVDWNFVALFAAGGFVIGAASGTRLLDWIQDRMDGLWW